MRKIVVALVFLGMVIAASLPTSIWATGDAGSVGTVKIATVDLARALNEVEEGKKAKANLEKSFTAKKGELDKVKNEITALRDDLEKKGQLLSQEALAGKRDEYQKKFMEYQQKAKDYTEELARKESEATGKIIDKLRSVVGEIASRDGYTFVFEKSAGGVVYGPTNADITNEVIKQYNK